MRIETALNQIARDMAVIREQIVQAEESRADLRMDLVRVFEAMSNEIAGLKKNGGASRSKSEAGVARGFAGGIAGEPGASLPGDYSPRQAGAYRPARAARIAAPIG